METSAENEVAGRTTMAGTQGNLEGLPRGRPETGRRVRMILFGVLAIALAAGAWAMVADKTTSSASAVQGASRPEDPRPAPATSGDPNTVTLEGGQARAVKLQPGTLHAFREEKIATGKIGFNEDASTPVFSPYSGGSSPCWRSPAMTSSAAPRSSRSIPPISSKPRPT